MEDVARLTIRPHGSYRLTGPVVLIDPTGVEHLVPAGKMVALCRCGHSKEKPFCDAAHKQCGFQDESPITRNLAE